MHQSNEILVNARARAVSKALPYLGEVTPHEAWDLLQSMPNVKLVDVRTQAEWQWVGVVPGAQLIELKSYPSMANNPDFMTQLKAAVGPENIVLFLCRSGARSDAAAALAAQHGYDSALNILEGFEGDLDSLGHRGGKNGWQAAGLPWTQG